MRKVIIFLITLTAITLAQVEIPFELDLKTRLVNDSITLVNIQITNLIDKPLDYVEGFVREINGDKELINEGIARELVNRIQNHRKEIGLLVTDKIILKIQKDNIIEKAIFENRDYIVNETLANDLIFVESIEKGIEIKFDNINTKLSIHKNN